MFAGITLGGGKKNYLTVYHEPADPEIPFTITFLMGSDSLNVHLTKSEMEKLFFEISTALQESDMADIENKINKVFE